MPRQAKKVLIPVVPQLNKPKEEEEEEKDEEDALFGDDKTGKYENGGDRVTLNGKAPKAEAEDANSDEDEMHVAPKSVDDLTSMVSSIVIATEENGIMLDFSEPMQADSAPSSCSSDTARSDTSLLSRVRDRTASMKRSLTPTLRRKKSVTSTDTLSTTATECDAASSTSSTPTKPSGGLPRVSPNRILKPACPPPPPPSRPNAPPPPPPPSSQNCQNGLKQSDSNQEMVSQAQAAKQPPTRARVAPPAPPARAPTTKISASIENILVADSQTVFKGSQEVTNSKGSPEEIPRTGFDFLDNW